MTPRFISKTSIGIWTLLLSPFLGTILFSYNLNEVGKRLWSWPIMIVGILWTPLLRKVLTPLLGNEMASFFLANAMGSLLLITLVWKLTLGEYPTYTIRPAWTPVIIFVAICGGLWGLQWLFSKG
jgi:hypothetical protein